MDPYNIPIFRPYQRWLIRLADSSAGRGLQRRMPRKLIALGLLAVCGGVLPFGLWIRSAALTEPAALWLVCGYAAFGMALGLASSLSIGGLVDLPAGMMDERQQHVRSRAMARCYWIGVFLFGFVFGVSRHTPTVQDLYPVMIMAVLIFACAPMIILGWTLPEPLEDDDDEEEQDFAA